MSLSFTNSGVTFPDSSTQATAASISYPISIANGGTGSTTASAALVALGIISATTGSLILPVGSTLQRDASPVQGYLRYNTTLAQLECYTGTTWAAVTSSFVLGGDAGGNLVSVNSTIPVTLASTPGSATGMTDSVILGYLASANQTGASTSYNSYAVALGAYAAQGSSTFANNSANYTVAVGYKALGNSGVSTNSVAVGYQALLNLGNTDVIGIGYNAGAGITSSGNAIAIGSSALNTSASVIGAVAVGYQALGGTSGGNFSIALGYQALNGTSPVTGTSLIGVGAYTFPNGGSGAYAIGIGYQAGYAQSYNVNIGYKSGYNGIGTGGGAVIIGANTLNSDDYTVAVGYQAGAYNGNTGANYIGTYCTFLGYNSGINNVSGLSYATAIGAGAVVGTSNTIVLGRAGTDHVIIGATTDDASGNTLQVTDNAKITGTLTVGTLSATSISAFPATPVDVQTGTSYVLALTDAPATTGYRGTVTLNNASAISLTVPPNSSVAFPVGTTVKVIQLGAGAVSFVAGSGVTLNQPTSLLSAAQYQTFNLTQVAANSWIISN